MRKLLLTVFMLLVMSTSCLAAADWQWVESDANMGWFYDKNSITFMMNKNIVNRDKVVVWTKIVYDGAYAQKNGMGNERYAIGKIYIDLAHNKLLIGKAYFYDNEGNVVSTSPAEKKWDDIIPGSHGDKIAKVVSDFIRTRTEEIEQRTRNAH